MLAHGEHHYPCKVPTITCHILHTESSLFLNHTTQHKYFLATNHISSFLSPSPHSVAEAPPLNKGQLFLAHLSLAGIASSFALVGTAPLQHNLPTAVVLIKSHGIHSLWSGSLSLLRYSQEQRGRGKRERVRMRGECLIIVYVIFVLILKTGTPLPWLLCLQSKSSCT